MLDTVIDAVIASINKLHGGEREQRSKHDDYMNFLRTRADCQRKIIPTVPYRESRND